MDWDLLPQKPVLAPCTGIPDTNEVARFFVTDVRVLAATEH